MEVTVDVTGGATRQVSVDADATYGDLLDPLDVQPDEVAVVAGGRHVPLDDTVDADRVQVIRLVKGG